MDQDHWYIYMMQVVMEAQSERRDLDHKRSSK